MSDSINDRMEAVIRKIDFDSKLLKERLEIFKTLRDCRPIQEWAEEHFIALKMLERH